MRSTRLLDIADVVYGFPFDSTYFRTQGLGTPLIRIRDLRSGECSVSTTEAALPKYRVAQGDVVVGMDGEFRPYLWTGRESLLNQRVCKVVPRAGSHLRPLLQASLAPALRAVEREKTGTTVIHIGKSDFDSLELAWPEDEQEATRLSRIVGSIHDKIELNRRMNATLEATAKAIFKAWFVDFEALPVEAARREPVTMVAEASVRFGRQSSRSDLPRGWRSSSLDQIAEFRNGLALQKYPAIDGEPRLPVIKIAQMRAGRPSEDEFAAGPLDSAYVVDDGDVLFSWSGSLEICLWTGGRGALNQHLFKVSSEVTPKWYYLLWTRYHLPSFREIAANKATTMGHIQRHHLTEAEVLIPPQGVIGAMGRVLGPIVEEQVRLGIESRALEQVRNTLLPRLLSGEVRAREPRGHAHA